MTIRARTVLARLRPTGWMRRPLTRKRTTATAQARPDAAARISPSERESATGSDMDVIV